MADLSEEELQALYCWIDEIPLSRTKKNISRDFSDAVLTAEIVHHFLPQLVELHNYSPANSSTQKTENWRTLNRKVFSKLNFTLPDDIIQSASASKAGVIEFILFTLRAKIERYLQNRAKAQDLPLDGAYTYDSTELATSDAYTCDNYGQFDQLRHTGPAANAQLQHVGFPQPVSETRYNQSQVTTETCFNPSHLEYTDTQLPLPIASTMKHPHGHFHSKLRPPTLYHHHTHPPQHHTSTLPPLHHHSNISSGGGGGGGVTQLQGGTLKAPHHTLSKLPTIVHGRSKTYAGRNNRIGPPPPLNGASGGKRVDSAKQKIRLAEKEQKLYETQEYIQLLQMKVTRLEHLMQIKDMKINELQRQLAMTSRYPLHKR